MHFMLVVFNFMVQSSDLKEDFNPEAVVNLFGLDDKINDLYWIYQKEIFIKNIYLYLCY